MKSRFTVTFVFVFCLSIASIRAEEGASQESQLQGVWIFSEGEANGQALDQLLQKRGLDGFQIKFSDDLMVMAGFGGADHTWRFTLKPMNQPKEIRLVAVETQGKAPKGATLTAIYEIEEDVLKLCLPADSTVETPEKFEAPSGSHLSMLVLKRQLNDDKSRAKAPGVARQ